MSVEISLACVRSAGQTRRRRLGALMVIRHELAVRRLEPTSAYQSATPLVWSLMDAPNACRKALRRLAPPRLHRARRAVANVFSKRQTQKEANKAGSPSRNPDSTFSDVSAFEQKGQPLDKKRGSGPQSTQEVQRSQLRENRLGRRASDEARPSMRCGTSWHSLSSWMLASKEDSLRQRAKCSGGLRML